MIISLIAALGKNRELGLDNQMLWHIKEDFQHFKKTTMGHTLFMGRKTFESIGNPLPGRKTFILSRSPYKHADCVNVHSFEEGIQKALESGETELFIAGGGEVYSQALKKGLVQRMYLSFVDFEGKADTFFPEFNYDEWKEVESTTFASKEKTPSWTLSLFEKI